MIALPTQYQWLYNEGAPKMLVEAIRHYGTLEHKGKGSNPDITAWAKELNVQGFYTDDDIAWCGLFVGMVAKRAGYIIPAGLKVLGAIHFSMFGEGVEPGKEMLWDILVFKRPGGGHVGFYAGENKTQFLVYGGNQANSVGFAWVAKNRLVAARRPVYKIGQPANVRKIFVGEGGKASTNEA